MRSFVWPHPVRAFLPVLAVLSAGMMLISGCTGQAGTVGADGGETSMPSTTAPATSSPGVSSSSAPVPGSAPASPRAQTSSPRLTSPYLPLWPFADGQQVRAWQAGYQTGGRQPWHLSANQTALSFTQGYLRYTTVNRVVRTAIDGVHARVAVGFLDPDGRRLSTAAVIHLVRFGSDRFAPWEVVGTDDTTFSLTTPAYGAHVTTRMTVGGRITGVDESIKVQVRGLSLSSPIGMSAPIPAGGHNQPWSTTVMVGGTADRVLTIAAATGGHVAAVERFTITGARR
jgi:hypothetical protein